MDRFIMFGGPCFYARGGFKDLIGQAPTIDAARARVTGIVVETENSSHGVEWWQIVDTVTGEIVAKSDNDALGGDVGSAEPHNLVFLGGYLVPEAVELDDDDGR